VINSDWLFLTFLKNPISVNLVRDENLIFHIAKRNKLCVRGCVVARKKIFLTTARIFKVRGECETLLLNT
jgi:hypothetical protein